ncbi:MAG: glycosyltransferase family 2 protein, partial [Gammaproteobacteria bacterium]|nr:glycosyltransferase family 2 protein [Gammaproteobacteria bacterium]
MQPQLTTRKKFNPSLLKIINIQPNELEQIAKQLCFETPACAFASIIIPVFNNIKYTLECLLSIQQCVVDIKYEIILVDDGSTDETYGLLHDVSGLRYIRQEKNLGYIFSCNNGASIALGKYLVFLNNDTQVTTGWLDNLLSPFSEMKYVGAVGPKVLYPDGVLQEAGARIHLDCTTSLIGRTDNPKKPAYNYMREVDYCSGCCLALENQQFVSLKGFDSYFEPAYMRLRAKGLKTIYNPKAVIVHHLNVTSNQKENDYKLTCINNNKKKFSQRYQETINKIHEIENKNAKTHANGLNLGIIIPSLQKYGGAERFVIECVRYWQHKHNITLYATVINEALLAEHGISKQVKLVRLTG